jgi:predicted MPP superfamily phosphohydrolase
VFVDKNNNGVYDKPDGTVKDAIVSDQITTATTNAEGYYEFESSNNLGFVFLIQPNGYKIKGSFWKALPKDVAELNYNFQVIPLPNTTHFTFIHASDPHLSHESLERFQKFRQKVDSIVPSFVIMTGDLIKDALRVSEKEATSLYELYASEMSKFKVPVYNVPGNHEIFGIERNLSNVESSHPLFGKEMYRHYLGPDYYSFNYGGLHFVGLNSVDYHDMWYYGHIDSIQLAWLKRDISLSRRITPIITFNHIPLFSGGLSLWGFQEEEPGSTLIDINSKKHFRHLVTNASEVMSLLKNNLFSLALSGHYHAAQQFSIHGLLTRFNQTGALVGNGEMSGLTAPSGFTLYTVRNGKIDDGEFVPLK